IAEPGARIGVHSASVSGGRENTDTLGVTTLMAREAAAYGVPPAITGRMVTTKPGGVPAGVGAPGAATVSDWSRGFTFGTQNPSAPCDPPGGVGNAGDWRIGCRSGQTSLAQAGAQSGARAGAPASATAPSPAPAGTQSDWSRGFEDGRRGPCGAAPAGVANGADYTLGCASGRKAAGG